MRNRNKALLLILCGIFQNTPVVESMEFVKNSGNSLSKKNFIGNKRKFSSNKESDDSVSEKDSDGDVSKDDLSDKKFGNFEKKYSESEKEYGGERFTISSPISRDKYFRYSYILDKKFNDNGGDIFKDEYFHSDSKSFKTALRFNEIYDYESEDSENEFINNQENINKLKTLLDTLKRKIKTSEKIKKEDVAGLCEDVIGGVFTNSRARKHGIELANNDLDKNKKYKFRHLLFHKLFNTFKKSLENNGSVSFIKIYIDDFGDNDIEGIDKKYSNNTKKPQSYLHFALQRLHSDVDFIDIMGKAAVLEKTPCEAQKKNKSRKYNTSKNTFKYDTDQCKKVKFDAEHTILNDKTMDKYLNNVNICDRESIKSMFELVNIIFNKELNSSYLDNRIFKANRQRNDTLSIAISLKDFVEDEEFLKKYQSLKPKCKRLVCHILARLAAQSVILMDGGKLGAGIINRELDKINFGIKKRKKPIGELLKKLDEIKAPEDKNIKDDIKKCD